MPCRGAGAARIRCAVPTTEPPVPAEGPTPHAIAEWRAQHEAWRVSHAEWKSAKRGGPCRPRPRRRREQGEGSQELTAQAEAARAARRASRPRTSAAYVVTVLGVALIGGAIAALRALSVPDTAEVAIPIAFAVATLRSRPACSSRRCAVAVRGPRLHRDRVDGRDAHRHRGASIMPQGALVPPGYSISLDHSQRLVQPFGDAYMFASPGHDDIPVIELTQGTGDIWLTIDDDTASSSTRPMPER